MSPAILGLGNLLMQDDGVGVHAVRALNADPPAGSTLHDVGTAVFDVLGLLESAGCAIAIDAVDVGLPPGTVVTFQIDPDESCLPPPSLHDLDLPALLRSIPQHRRPRVLVVGVQPGVLAPGLELSDQVRNSIPLVLEAVRALASDADTAATGTREAKVEAQKAAPAA